MHGKSTPVQKRVLLAPGLSILSWHCQSTDAAKTRHSREEGEFACTGCFLASSDKRLGFAISLLQTTPNTSSLKSTSILEVGSRRSFCTF
jgi:hypothetical protein